MEGLLWLQERHFNLEFFSLKKVLKVKIIVYLFEISRGFKRFIFSLSVLSISSPRFVSTGIFWIWISISMLQFFTRGHSAMV